LKIQRKTDPSTRKGTFDATRFSFSPEFQPEKSELSFTSTKPENTKGAQNDTVIIDAIL